MTTILLKGSSYDVNRGGHAPGDVRDAFAEAFDAFGTWKSGEPEPTIELREHDVPISQIFELLCNCSDILPHRLVDQLKDEGADEEVENYTYGSAARWLRDQIIDEPEALPV